MNVLDLLPQLPPDNYFDAVILANGDYPSGALTKHMLANVPYVVCCDGAFRSFMSSGYMPDAIIGDGDSTTPEEKEQTKGLFHHIREQDDNDLTKAVRFVTEQGKKHLLLLGTTGKREDHTLGNISLLNHYFNQNIDAMILTEHGLFRIFHGDNTFNSFPGQQISIFNFGCTVLQSEGLKYSLFPLHELWEGTLNEALGTSFTIHSNGSYLLFFVQGNKTINN